jgi:predicted PurR-regulated permease PerM
MMTYIVIALGLVGVFLLWRISQQLQGLREEILKINDELQSDKKYAFVHDLREWLQEIPKGIVEELQWHKDSTFAHNLREWLQEVPIGVVEELQWHKDSTFAHNLREWLEEISESVTEQIQKAAKEISTILASIDDNTSHN